MISASDIILGKFEQLGVLQLDIEKCIKKWSKLCVVSKYNNTYRISRFKRKDSETRWYKFEISKSQAQTLIKKLNLKEHKSNVFPNSSVWRSE